MKHATRGYLYVLMAALLWSTLGPWARYAYSQGVHPGELVFWRAGTGALVALVWAFTRERDALLKAARSWSYLAIYGFISIGAFYLCYFWSIQLTTVAVAALLLYTAPLFVTVFSFLLLGEPLTGRKLTALGLALAGVALVSGLLGGVAGVTLSGLLTGLGAGLTYGLYSIFGKFAVKQNSPTAILPYVLGFGTLFLLPSLPPSRLLEPTYSLGMWFYLAAGGVFGTFVPYLLYTDGLIQVPASNASIVAMIEPVAASLWGWWLLAEGLSPIQVAGGLMVLAGALLARVRPK